MTDICRICKDEVSMNSYMEAEKARYHHDCFLCHACLQPFHEGVYYPSPDGTHLYCTDDYFMLFGERCAKCGDIIQSDVISAMGFKWHAEHFCCENCGISLTNKKYLKKNESPFCEECYTELKNKAMVKSMEICQQCEKPIADPKLKVVQKGKPYHHHHFSCSICNNTLGPYFREKDGKLYCQNDFYNSNPSLCFACKKPITGRITTAMSRTFHPEHFVCFHCEKPFSSGTFFEFRGKAYCEEHYNEALGKKCSKCFQWIKGKNISVMGKYWCESHFCCIGCEENLAGSSVKVLEWDTKPMCQNCYALIPSKIRKKIQQYKSIEKKALKKRSKENLTNL